MSTGALGVASARLAADRRAVQVGRGAAGVTEFEIAYAAETNHLIADPVPLSFDVVPDGWQVNGRD